MSHFSSELRTRVKYKMFGKQQQNNNVIRFMGLVACYRVFEARFTIKYTSPHPPHPLKTLFKEISEVCFFFWENKLQETKEMLSSAGVRVNEQRFHYLKIIHSKLMRLEFFWWLMQGWPPSRPPTAPSHCLHLSVYKLYAKVSIPKG